MKTTLPSRKKKKQTEKAKRKENSDHNNNTKSHHQQSQPSEQALSEMFWSYDANFKDVCEDVTTSELNDKLPLEGCLVLQ